MHLWRSNTENKSADIRAEHLTKSLIYCKNQRIGALCVLQRNTSLKEVWRTAIPLKSDITEELLISIFWPGTPLHDGAVVLDQESILAASCYLPLTEKADISRWYGTRHKRASGVLNERLRMAFVVFQKAGG